VSIQLVRPVPSRQEELIKKRHVHILVCVAAKIVKGPGRLIDRDITNPSHRACGCLLGASADPGASLEKTTCTTHVTKQKFNPSRSRTRQDHSINKYRKRDGFSRRIQATASLRLFINLYDFSLRLCPAASALRLGAFFYIQLRTTTITIRCLLADRRAS
jgi:hypothetical protein